MGKPEQAPVQLSLFESVAENQDHQEQPQKESTVIDIIRARFEKDPPKTQEEYKKWIRFLVTNSLRSMDRDE